MKADDVRADLRSFVVDAHGATVLAIPAEVDGWIDAAIERQDQGATDLLVHWIFEHAPQPSDDPGVCRLTSLIQKAAHG